MRYYKTAQWRKLRERCLVRDYRQCVLCTSTRRLTAHHIIARQDGGEDAIGNLVTLCHECHQQVEHRRQPASDLLARYLGQAPGYRAE